VGDTGDLSVHKTPTLSAGQNAALAESLIRFWTGPQEQLNAALKANGISRTPPAADDKRTPAEKTFDASNLAGVEASAYDLNGVYVGRKVEDMASVDKNMRTAFSAMQLPNALGRSLAEAILDANEHGYGTLTTDAQRANYTQHEKVLAVRASGAPSWDALIATVKLAVALIPQSIAQDFARAGIFEDHRTLAILYGQGQRLAQRAKMKAK
jgi:hypothetical protein